MTLSHKPNSSVLLAASMIFAVVDSPLLAQSNADSGAAVTSVQGRVRMPDKAPEGINTDGLSLDDIVITLEGNYNHPRMPYPQNWSSMARDERSEWSQAFRNSEEYEDYTRKVEEARAKRDVFTTEIADDGSFVFNGIKPKWYQLTAMIMHPKATGKPTFEHSRAHAMRQFIIKSADEPYHVGVMTLKLKNVLMEGDPAPEWEATAYDGEKFSLSDSRGQFVLMDFWATWCGPCLAEIPNLEAAHEEFGGDRLAVIGLSVDETIDIPKAFLQKKPSAYSQGFLDGDHYLAIREAYGIRSIPSIWLIGPDGKIVARDLRGKALREAVREALDAKATPGD